MFNLFLIFKSKVLPLLKNVNDEVSSNNKDEVATMMAAVPNLLDTITNYASHRLRSNVQFSAIEKNLQSMKIDPSIIYMVPDHKKNVFQMRYWDGKVDYFGKKGMSLLGIVEIRWKVDREISGFEYPFVYYSIKGYSGRDHVQVAAVMKLALDTVKYYHPATKKVIIQSNNASGFASQELIPFVFNIQTSLDDGKMLFRAYGYS